MCDFVVSGVSMFGSSIKKKHAPPFCQTVGSSFDLARGKRMFDKGRRTVDNFTDTAHEASQNRS